MLTVADSDASAARRTRSLWVGGNVVFLGLTGLFTDVSSEMVSAVGYSLSAVCKLGLLAAGNAWFRATGVLFVAATWIVPADGEGQPRLFLPKAYSPVVLR